MKKTLKSFIIFSIVFVLLFPNITVIAASVSDDLRVANTIYEAVQTISSEQKGDIEIYIKERLPINEDGSSFHIILVGEDGNEQQHSTVPNPNSNTLYYLFNNLPIGKYTLEISGTNYLPYEQEILLGNETVRLNLTNAHDGDNSIIKNDKKIGVIAYGDVNEDKQINSADKEEMITAIESHSTDSKYDLNKDGYVNIVDLSYISFNVDKQNREATPIRSVNMESVTVSEPDKEKVSYTGNLEDIKKNNDSFVSFAPKSGDISGDNPIEISLDLSTNTNESEAIVIAPSPFPENNIKEGTIDVVVAENGEEVTKTYAIGANNLQAMFEFRLASNVGIMPVNVNMAEIQPDGSIVIDLGDQIAIKKVTIKVTKTGSNKLADISKVEFLNNMEDRISAPELDIPEGLTAIEKDKEFTVNWKKARNVTGYDVSISSNGVNEVKRVDSNTLKVTSFNGQELKNGTKYEVRVQSINGDWKSGYCTPIIVTPQPSSKPPMPENLTVTAGYRFLTASWKMMEDTDSYDVYYKKSSESEYKLAVENLKSNTFTIRELEDDVTYTVKVNGKNILGTGPAAWSERTTATNLTYPQLPNRNLINTPTEQGQITMHIKDAWYAYQQSNNKMVNSTLDEGRTLEKNDEFNTRYSALGLVDNDYSSYYSIDSWNAGGQYKSRNLAFTFEFDEPQTVSYITFADYQYVGVFAQADVFYKDKDGNWNTLYNIRINQKEDAEGKKYHFIKLPKPVEATCISFAIGGYAGRTSITVSEVRFYGYDGIEKEIDDLFGDEMHITLADGIELEQINAVETKLKTEDVETKELHPDQSVLQKEIDLARDIFNNADTRTPMEIDTSVSSAFDSNITFLGGLNPGQPLGIVAHKGDELIIYVGDPLRENGASTELELVLTQYHGNSASWYQSLGNLKVGKNVIPINGVNGFDDNASINNEKAEKGGSLYINYNYDANKGTTLKEDYKVRVIGGHEIPVLDLTKLDTEEEKKGAIRTYIGKLKDYVENKERKHNEICKQETDEAIQSSTFDDKNCILGATEIVLDKMMYSVPSEMIYTGLTGSDDAKVNQLYDSLVAMEDMIDLFYSHKGLYKTDSKTDLNRYPTTRLNTRYQRMFYGAFMYAGGKHIGIEWGSVAGLTNGKPIVEENGKYVSGNYFGWGIAHEIGHIINESAYTVTEVTNNYFSILSQADESNDLVRFKYEDVYDKVTSGVKGRASNVFTQLGMYWQLHLAYDTGYNFKMYDTSEDQFDNLIFARMDTYARELASAGKSTRAPGKNNNTLTLDGADTDNKLMRLACAAAGEKGDYGRNLLEFFERWGMIPDKETIEYASQFTKETRPIYYINDEARAYKLEGHTGMAEGTKVNAELSYNKGSNQVTLTLSNTGNEDAMLGYEIIRSYREQDPEDITKDRIVERAVAFVPIDETEYTDTINTINNRVFTYSVRAVDKYLNVTETEVLEPIKISHDGSIDKTNWTAETNLVSSADKTGDELTGESTLPCEPEKVSSIKNIIDDDIGTSYTGHIKSEEDSRGEIIISLNEVEMAAALKYVGGYLGHCEIQISENAHHWITVNETDITGNTTLYFDDDEKEKEELHFYDVAFVKIILDDATENEDITISEIDLIGETGDNVELLQEGIGILSKDYIYEQKTGEKIPAGSLVFTGTYKGNPGYNVVLLRDEDGNLIEGEQIILANVPEDGPLGEVKEGKWIYWITPEELEKMGVSIKEIEYQLGTFFEETEFNDELDLEDPNFEYVEETPPSFESEDNELEHTENESTSGENLNNENDNLFNDDNSSLQEDDNSLSGDEMASGDDNVDFVESETLNDDENDATGISKTYTGLPTKVRAELYRVNNAQTNEGERLVSDTMYIELPEELQDISFN